MPHCIARSSTPILTAALLLTHLSVMTPTTASAQDTGAVTYKNPGQTQRLYAFTGDGVGKISLNFYKDGHWAWRSQGPGQNATVYGDPGAIATFDPASGEHDMHAFVRTPTGRLWANSWDGSTWGWQDHGTPGGTAPNTGPVALMVGSAGGVAYQDGSAPPEAHVFVLGEIQGVVGSPPIELFRRHLGSAGWEWDYEETPDGVDQLYGTPSVVTYREGSQPRRIYAFVRGDDGRLHVRFDKGTGFQWSTRGNPPFTTVTGSPAATTLFTNAGQHIYAYVRGGDGRLWVHHWNGSQWQWDERSKPSASVSITGSPGAITFKQDFLPQETHAFARGSDGRLYHYHLVGDEDTGTWQWHDRGIAAGTSPIAYGSTPDVTTYVDANGVQRVHVFVQGADGDLYLLHLKNGTWQWRPQGTP